MSAARTRDRTHAMAYVTAPDRTSARRIAHAVLEARLASCANLSPIESVFWWKGSLEEAKEVVLVFKTRRALVPRLIEAVRKAHPYAVPCIVAYPMESGYAPYLDWIDRETRVQR
ncbi:MAG TPA: divalent-cation tolerance protein CutA [Thermoplasmata archaeon]|nr:divalent-cation tolerance protein CutA [Thermoplasmata archaeon]